MPLHPAEVLFAGEKPFPALPAVDHYAGSEKLMLKALSMQQVMGPIFDLTCDCEDGARAGAEAEHAQMVVGLVNAGVIGLRPAISVIMGANIGTTLGNGLIALPLGPLGLLLAGFFALVYVFAKDDRTHRELSMQFETRKVFKEYVAIAAGELGRDSDYIEGAMKMHPHDRLRMIVSSDPDAKPALSYYEVLERFRGFTLVKVQPRTGRTHQIRVHLLHVGSPVLADKLYGGRSEITRGQLRPGHALPGQREGEGQVVLARQALHARRIRLQHPVSGQPIEFEAPVPSDMLAVWAELRAVAEEARVPRSSTRPQ